MPHLDESVLKHLRHEFISVRSDLTVEGALAEARLATPKARFLYFYVIDEKRRLVGVVPTRKLLLSKPTELISEIMQPRVISLPDTATLVDACEFFLLHRYLALPVLDCEKRIVGIVDVEVYAEEMSGLAQQQHDEESEDFFQLIGVRLAEVRKASIGTTFGYRFPWLICNMVGGFAAAFVAGWFQGVLDRAIALALFIPIVLALAESVSIQTLTLTLQAQHGRTTYRFKQAIKALRHELPIGLLLGIASATCVAVVAGIWLGTLAITVCLLLSVAISVTLAALIGVFVPITLHTSKLDPKIAAGPLTLTLTDVTALTIYLSIASALL